VAVPAWLTWLLAALALAVALGGLAAYLKARPAARGLVWPAAATRPTA
jgi:hypothetical protein